MQTELEVFVVDDDDAVRDSLTVLIQSAGFDVQAFDSAEAFIESHEPTRQGCLLLDVRMPGMSGLELQRRLKAEKNTLPIIFMTGHGDIPMAVQAMKLGAAGFIEKPYREKELLESIRSVMDLIQRGGAPYISSEAAARLERLTPRERDVFRQIAMGDPNKAVARALGISPRTVEIHRARVMEKLQVQNLAELIKLGIFLEINPPQV